MRKIWTLEEALDKLDELSQDQKPSWGTMNAQRMVEHLSDMLMIASGKKPMGLAVPPDKAEKLQRFLYSDKPMAKNTTVELAPVKFKLRHENIELAIDEFSEEWIDFEETLDDPSITTVHPFYGSLNREKWDLLNGKHLNHHFEQFGLI
jgi:oxepin-CoA hydrolase/3-oxo-5,6-dehydrosuberyl-CoA semialdehyde dehydrogenase